MKSKEGHTRQSGLERGPQRKKCEPGGPLSLGLIVILEAFCNWTLPAGFHLADYVMF